MQHIYFTIAHSLEQAGCPVQPSQRLLYPWHLQQLPARAMVAEQHLQHGRRGGKLALSGCFLRSCVCRLLTRAWPSSPQHVGCRSRRCAAARTLPQLQVRSSVISRQAHRRQRDGWQDQLVGCDHGVPVQRSNEAPAARVRHQQQGQQPQGSAAVQVQVAADACTGSNAQDALCKRCCSIARPSSSPAGMATHHTGRAGR